MFYMKYISCLDLVKHFKSKTKLERRQSVAVMETIKSPKGGKRASSQLKASKSGG